MNDRGLDTSNVALHPSPVRLAAFGAGKPEVDECSTIAEHISSCDLCRRLVEAVADDTLGALLRRGNDRWKAGGLEDAKRREDGRPAPPSGYEVLGVLGQGGMGVVYQARQIGLDRLVALKQHRPEILASVDGLARFRREAEAAARLRHANIVPIFDVGWRDGIPFYSMEYIEGGTLGARLAAGPIDPATASRLVEKLARAVHHAHEAGVVHRDLKPSNVLLAPDLENAKISDFGLAKLDDATRTRSGAILGTPCYMAPEQADGDSSRVGPPADVYALGAILYEALTGRPPFRGSTIFETLEMVRTAQPLPPRRTRGEISRDLETIALKCLEKSPVRRYASAQALADDLRRHLDREPIVARPVSTPERLAKWAARRPWQATSAALGMAVLIVVVAGTLVSNARLRAQVFQTELKAKEARAQQSRADEHYHSARASIRRMTDLFDEPGYAERPLLREVRRQQLGVALAFYQAVVRDDEPIEFAGRLDKAAALRELAGFQILSGNRDEAQSTLQRALALIDDLEAGRPDDPDVALEHVDILIKLAIANTKRIDEAAAEYQKAIERAERALRSDPDLLRLGEALAMTHDNLGCMLQETGRLRDAGTHLSKAAEIRRRLVMAHPDRSDLKGRLAENMTNLGVNRMTLGERDRAEEAYAESERFLKPLVKAQPEIRAWVLALGKLYLNWGTNERFDPTSGRSRQFDRAIGRYRAGYEQVEAVLRVISDWPEARLVARNLNVSLADALGESGRHREAVDYWDHAIALDEGELRLAFRMNLACSLAYAGDAPKKALAEAEAIAKEVQSLKCPDWYNLACVASLAGRSYQKSGSDALAEEAAVRAMEWLRQACDPKGVGSTDVLATLKEGDKDIEFLHDRPDFKLVRGDVVFPPDPFRPDP